MTPASGPPPSERRGAPLFSLDLRSIGAFRIALGVALLLDLATRAVDLEAHYSDHGVLTRWSIFSDPARSAFWSMHLAIGSSAGQAVLFLFAAALAVMLLLGFKPRLAAVASLFFLVSLQNRTPPVFYGFDLLLRVCLMWACFLPLGARFSLEAREKKEEPGPDALLSPATLALTLQMVFVYVFSGLQKVQDDSWTQLTAVFYGFTTDHHATGLARLLASSPDLCRLLALSVLVVELLAPALLFVPWARDKLRLLSVVLFASFHLGTAAVLHLGLFPIMGALAWIAFLPASVWERARVVTRPGLVVDRRPLGAVLVGAALIVVLAYNLESVLDRRLLSPAARKATFALRLDQTWNMFRRPMADGWFVGHAKLDDGREVDLMNGGAPVSFDKPADLAGRFSSMRWRKYVTMLVASRDGRDRPLYAVWLCRSWNRKADAAGTARAESVEVIFFREREEPDGREPTITRQQLASLRCEPPLDDSRRAAKRDL
jgi:uncharacterized membrane protein YphA (DoxX/SURF4 family)